jgi:hypothetical protein
MFLSLVEMHSHDVRLPKANEPTTRPRSWAMHFVAEDGIGGLEEGMEAKGAKVWPTIWVMNGG